MANTAATSERSSIESATEPLLEAMTHRCSRYGHPEFLLRWDDRRTLLADVRSLAETLEAAVARGVRFQPGEVVRVGSVPLRVVEAPSRALTLVEPDFLGTPLRYVPGVDAALGHLRAQEELAERVGLSDRLVHASLDQTVRLCPYATAAGAVLDRSESIGAASGWMVGCGLDANDDDERDRHEATTVTLYELVCKFPHLVDVLGLPPGTTVACTSVGDAIVWHDGLEVGVRGGALIDARVSRITRSGSEDSLARCSSIR
jgi:hypothetical protein